MLQVKTQSKEKKEIVVNRGISAALNTNVPMNMFVKQKIRCVINGIIYNDFTEAAYEIDGTNLVAAEVERRCRSTKMKYRDWRIEGVDKKPVLKISLDDQLFESPIHASQYIDMSPTEIRNRIYSKNPQYRHWVQLDNPVTTLSYLEVDNRLEGCNIRLALPTIQCEGKAFLSITDAATHLDISDERVRQKLISSFHKDYIYLV